MPNKRLIRLRSMQLDKLFASLDFDLDRANLMSKHHCGQRRLNQPGPCISASALYAVHPASIVS
ncbi:hypothetical protein NXZ67_07630 [Xanthomonas hortorum pv. pelargonii]|uniref:hypothetical protein n=1 Tax=Xanthomonas hortorum TaxID=56454 RepID=UPI0021C8339C|nr:hypothetical protein [Xanthomonas hortorum]MCU1704198.1 hypothetical protein [Xanthomonas hortorum pv. pelargonii]